MGERPDTTATSVPAPKVPERVGVGVLPSSQPELPLRDPGPGFGGPGRCQSGDDVVLRREGDWRGSHCSSSPVSRPGTCWCLRVSR